jgi:hypothetical protein
MSASDTKSTIVPSQQLPDRGKQTAKTKFQID